jgi:hypothetical protein
LTRGDPSPLCTTCMGAPQNVPDMFILKTETPRESRPQSKRRKRKKSPPGASRAGFQRPRGARLKEFRVKAEFRASGIRFQNGSFGNRIRRRNRS